MRWLVPFALASVALAASSAAAQGFTYDPPGTLVPANSGTGRVDEVVYAPGIRFPIERGPAFANSQVYGHGGSQGPGGGQCDGANFQYPWHDNYCETRNTSSWSTPLCPNKSGGQHYGQDVRAASCESNVHPAVATVDGTISSIGSYSVNLMSDDGVKFQYLHMRGIAVSSGQRVTRGQHLGNVSDNFGGTSTTVHLHISFTQNVAGIGQTYVPPYTSLVASYKALLGDADFAAELVNRSPYEITTSPGLETRVWIELKNTGKKPWTPGKTFLGTTFPRDVQSPMAAPSWINPGRVATVKKVVAPGETTRFDFELTVPAATGLYGQSFNLVEEGAAWFSDQGGPSDDAIGFALIVTPDVPYRAQFLRFSWSPNNTPAKLEQGTVVAGYAEFQNTGTATWSPETTTLVTTEPRDHDSPWAHVTWVTPGRPAGVDEVTGPGETGRFAFRIQTPMDLGITTEHFGIYDSEGGWFGDLGGPKDDAVKLDVESVPLGSLEKDRPKADGGCATASAPTSAPSAWLVIAAVAGAVVARRRRARAAQ